MDEKTKAELRVKAASGAVYAHAERAADESEARVARGRLAEALAAYRRILRQDR